MIKTILPFACITVLFASSFAWAKIGGGDIIFPVKNKGKVLFSHDVHVSRGSLGCTACHYEIFARAANSAKDRATMAEMVSGKSCGSCHNGQRAFGVDKNCSRCHQSPLTSL